jgi:predicted dehydrogenase
MSKIRIGMIGVGQIAKSHLKQYTDINDAEIVAACDINERELEAVSDEHAIPHRYTDFRKMLERDDLDSVDVCLHNNLHAGATIAALEAGKNVYCEKPIAGTYADGKRMVEAAAATSKMLHIQLATLYSKETRAAKTIIDAGELGSAYHARSTGFRRRGRPYVDGYGSPRFVQKEVSAGGAMFDMGVYHIAQLVYLLGLPTMERVSGKVYQETAMDEKRRSESGYNVEELGLGLVRFAGGLTLDIIEAWAIQLDGFEGSSIVGSKGGIRLDPFGFYSTFCDMNMNSSVDLGYMEYRNHQLGTNEDAYDSSQHHWIAAQQERVPLLPTAQVALTTMLIQEGVYLSDHLGREVSAKEVAEASTSKAISL